MYQQQVKDKIAEYRALNRVAGTGGVVLFGSTAASKLPLNELMQDYGIHVAAYNRSAEGLTLENAEPYIAACITPLRPKVILLHFGEEELLHGSKSVAAIAEDYRWLLYQLHTALPKSRLVLVAVSNDVPDAAVFNRLLKTLAQEYGCTFTEGPDDSADGTYLIRFFHTLRAFFFDKTMTLADALQCYSVS